MVGVRIAYSDSSSYNNYQFCLRRLAVDKMATNIWRYFTLRMRDYPWHVSIRFANIYSILSSINIYPLLNTVLKTHKKVVFWMSVAYWCSTCFCIVLCVFLCTDHFVIVPFKLTCLHCLQHSFFEHLFNLYYLKTKI